MKIISEADMLRLGQIIGRALSPPAVIELVGDVGAGKTTFTRGLAQGLGITEPVTSPSFTIAKRYPLQDGELIHYDFYRLPDPGIMRAELAETLQQSNIVIIEWGTAVAHLLPDQHYRLDFTLNPDGSRIITQTGFSPEMWKTCGKLLRSSGKPVDNLSNSVDKSPQACGKSVENRCETPAQPHPAQVLSGFKHHQLSALPLFLDTSTDLCRLQIGQQQYSWSARHDLAEKIFSFIHDKLQADGRDWSDLTEIHYFSGPGSFTGLRIGAALVNALADQLQIPLYDHHDQQHQIILPDYGRPAHISTPRK